MIIANPLKNPNEFHDPITLSVLLFKKPKENVCGDTNLKTWKSKTAEKAMITPMSTIFALCESDNTTEEININMKQEKINQKVPMSSIDPNKDTEGTFESMEDKNTISTTNIPANKTLDLGTVTFFSANRADIQKIVEIVSPKTNNRPLAGSIGIFTKGTKNIGKKETVQKRAQNEILSKVFDNISIYYTISSPLKTTKSRC